MFLAKTFYLSSLVIFSSFFIASAYFKHSVNLRLQGVSLRIVENWRL